MWYVPVIPLLALVLVIVACTAAADGLRDAIDPDHTMGTSAPGEFAAAGGGG